MKIDSQVKVNQIMKIIPLNQRRYLKQRVKINRFLKFFNQKKIKKIKKIKRRKSDRHTNFGRINIFKILRKMKLAKMRKKNIKSTKKFGIQ